MDSFDVSNVKAEKMNAMLRYRRLRKIANLFRCFEVCMALILLSWFTTRLPIAVKNSGHYFKEFCEILLSPRFVFLVGNAIILTLFAKSGHFFSHGFNPNTSATDSLYDEFVKNNHHDNIQTRQKSQSSNTPPPSPAAPPPEEFTCENKDTMYEEGEVKTLTLSYPDGHINSSNPKIVFRRTQSENLKLKLKTEPKEKPRQKLLRSETELCWKVGRDAEQEEEDNMSNEEFQRKVEAFIAKHQKFQREEESMDMVLQNLND